MRSLFFLLALLPLTVLAGSGLPDAPYLYVEGKAEVEKPADIVKLRFDVEVRQAEQAKANQELQANAAKIFALLDERKIAHDDVIATELRSQPEYEGGEEYSRRTRGKLVGYSVTRTFAVKVRDVTVFSRLVNDLLAFNAVRFTGIETELSNQKQVDEELSQQALINAREKAERTASATGMKIDSVYAISPTSFPGIVQHFFGYDIAREAATERVIVTGSPEYRLAPITISQNVHVIYLISPAR